MEYDIDIEYPMQSLYIAKTFHVHGCLDRLLSILDDDVTIAWDELACIEQASIECVFADSRCYTQKGKERGIDSYEPDRDTYVLRDPILTRYDDLCRELEMKLGITTVENSFAKELEHVIHQKMQFSSYSYDYRWIDSTQDKKGAKIVLFLFDEFYPYYEVAQALFSILDFCKEKICGLETAVLDASKKKIIQLPVQTRQQKEAA